MVLSFNKSIFNYQLIEGIYIFWVKWDYQVLWDFQASVYVNIVTNIVYSYMYHC